MYQVTPMGVWCVETHRYVNPKDLPEEIREMLYFLWGRK